MKKYALKIVLLNLNMLSIEGTLMIHSYVLARSSTSKNFEIIYIVKIKNIRFTSETKSENFISFLDIEISRNNNKFTTSVYRKPNYSGVFTNFRSFIPESNKYKLQFNSLHRAFKLCSNFELFIRRLTS